MREPFSVLQCVLEYVLKCVLKCVRECVLRMCPEIPFTGVREPFSKLLPLFDAVLFGFRCVSLNESLNESLNVSSALL